MLRWENLKYVRELSFDEDCELKFPSLNKSDSFYGLLPDYCKDMFEVCRNIFMHVIFFYLSYLNNNQWNYCNLYQMVTNHAASSPKGPGSFKALSKSMDLLCNCIHAVCFFKENQNSCKWALGWLQAWSLAGCKFIIYIYIYACINFTRTCIYLLPIINYFLRETAHLGTTNARYSWTRLTFFSWFLMLEHTGSKFKLTKMIGSLQQAEKDMHIDG